MVFERMAGPKFLRGKTISLLIFFANYLNHFYAIALTQIKKIRAKLFKQILKTNITKKSNDCLNRNNYRRKSGWCTFISII